MKAADPVALAHESAREVIEALRSQMSQSARKVRALADVVADADADPDTAALALAELRRVAALLAAAAGGGR